MSQQTLYDLVNIGKKKTCDPVTKVNIDSIYILILKN